ncbi:MAG TPA: hypothetical protein VMW66_03465 [Elusimicrobiales bacterium]|nr:hypothetical protein [Elusimicrobiales bacterium]
MQKVKLKHNGSEIELDLQHAEKILNSRNNKLKKPFVYELADKNYEIDANGKIIRRKKHKGDSGESEVSQGD